MASKTTQPKRHALDVGERTGPALAASVGLGLLSAAKAERWDLLDTITEKQWAGLSAIDLTTDQRAALDEWSAVLPVLRTKPLQTVYCCDTCGRWAVVGSQGSTPATCNLSWACAGRTMKGSAPKKTPISPWEPTAEVTHHRFTDLSNRIAEMRAPVLTEMAALAKELDDRIAKIKTTVDRDRFDDWPTVRTIFLDREGVRVRVPRTEDSTEAVGRIRELLASLPVNPVLAKPSPWLNGTCSVPAAARKHDPDTLTEASEAALDTYWDTTVDEWNAAVIAHMCDVADTAFDTTVDHFVVHHDPDDDTTRIAGLVTDDHDGLVDRDDHDAWAVLDRLTAALDARAEDSDQIEADSDEDGTFLLLRAD